MINLTHFFDNDIKNYKYGAHYSSESCSRILTHLFVNLFDWKKSYIFFLFFSVIATFWTFVPTYRDIKYYTTKRINQFHCKKRVSDNNIWNWLVTWKKFMLSSFLVNFVSKRNVVIQLTNPKCTYSPQSIRLSNKYYTISNKCKFYR